MKDRMNEVRILIPPVSVGEKELYPVVRVSSLTSDRGIFLSVDPLGLFVREKEDWFFTSLSDEISTIEDLINRIQVD